MKTVIDVDDELLRQAAAELGTRSKRDTVNQALAMVARRRSHLAEILDSPLLFGGADLDDEEVMKDARR